MPVLNVAAGRALRGTLGGGKDARVVLLLNFEQANNSTSIIDESLYARTMTAVGNAKVSSAQAKFGLGSGIFANNQGVGVGTDWINAAESADLSFGTGDFTVESWVRRSGSQASYVGLMCCNNAATAGWGFIFGDGAGGGPANSIYFGDLGFIAGSTVLADNTWTHVAVGRREGVIRKFIGGIQDGQVSDSGNLNTGGNGLTIGRLNTTQNGLGYTGYIDGIRITKGHCWYTNNFQPQERPFW